MVALARFFCSDLLQALLGPRDCLSAHVTCVTWNAGRPGDFYEDLMDPGPGGLAAQGKKALGGQDQMPSDNLHVSSGRGRTSVVVGVGVKNRVFSQAGWKGGGRGAGKECPASGGPQSPRPGI